MIMRKRLLALAAALALSTALYSPTQVHAETWEEILLYAYETNPTLEAARAYYKGTQENTTIAFAKFLPSAEASGTYGIDRYKNAPKGTPTVRNEIQPMSGKVSASQNLFAGFGDLASYRAAGATVKQAEQYMVDTEQSTLLDAGTIYMDVLRDEALLELQRNNEAILTKHLDSYRQRFKVGVVTRTDIDQSVSRLERAKATRIAAEGQLASTKATYRRIIGKAPVNLKPAPEGRLMKLVPEKLEDAVRRGLDINPTLLQQYYSDKASQENINVAEAGHYPSVDLTAYAQKAYADYHEGNRPFEDDYFAGVSVTLPLYTGGATQAGVRKAKGYAAQSRYTYQDMRRRVAEEVTTAFQTHQTSLAQIDSINAQIKAARSALDGVSREAQVGSRTVLDILDAQQELLNAEVALVEARRNANVSAMTLSYAMGGLTKKELKL